MEFIEINIPTGATDIIDQLTKAGYKAYVVGGCVRDSLAGFAPKDWDICTSATPQQTMDLFRQDRIIETGLKHGTITIVLEGIQYEVTTFRIDGTYSDGRRPDSVAYTDNLTADLSRRDFTMNAIAYNHADGLIDPFGGREDLLQKRIVTVGQAQDRFQEDALRILRAIRFAATYGYQIAPAVAEQIHQCKPLLSRVSHERIRDELVKILCGAHTLDVLLAYGDVFATIIPELSPCIGFDQHNPYHIYDVYDHMMYALSHDNTHDPIIKLALFFHDIGKPCCYSEDEKGGHFYGHSVRSKDMCEKIMTRLRFDHNTISAVSELVLYHDATIEPTHKSIKRWLNRIGEQQLLRLADVCLADSLAHAPQMHTDAAENWQQIKALVAEIVASQQCFSQKDLAVSGHDLLALGVKEGQEIGRILKALLQAVIDDAVANEKEALLSMAKDIM